MNEVETRQVRVEWNATDRRLPEPARIDALFSEQAAQNPSRIALALDGRTMTYAELDSQSSSLALRLRGLGVGRDTMVGIATTRSFELVVGLLAILKAGGAYVPLDPSYPAQRIALLVEDARVRIALDPDTEIALPDGVTRVVHDRSSVHEARPASRTSPGDAAYVLFTSGSTGKPKGVCVEHRSVVRLVRETDYADFRKDDVFLMYAPLAFDASTLEIWGALLNGATLAIAPPGVLDVDDLGKVITESGVTFLWLTSALFQQLVDHNVEALQRVRLLFTGGDVVPAAHADRLLRAAPSVRLVNGYGPTENTTFTTCHPIVETTPGSAIPIGKPIANSTTYILGADMSPVPIGVVGELYAGGLGVARGYVARPELTAEKFVPDPFSRRAGARMYRTGDQARFRPDGTIEFFGRTDHQVKVRGFRIELGEIEAALASRADVSAAAVVARENTPGGKRLVGYLVAAAGARIDVATVKTELGRSLPDYMVPSAIVVLDALPLTPSGKVDRKALPAPELTSTAAYVGPRNPMEEQLCSMFEELLGVSQVGVDDDFFELGGHSLVAASLTSRAHRRFDVRLDVRTIFDARTVRAIAQRIGERIEHDAFGEIARAEDDTRHRLSSEEARLWFLHRLDPHAPTYNECAAWCVDGVLDQAALARAFARLQERHEALRTRFVERDGLPMRVVDPPSGTPPVRRSKARDEAEAALEIRRLARQPYDLSKEHAWRAIVVDLGANRGAIALAMHHIVTDEWSLHVLFRDLSALYLAETGAGRGLSEKKIDYGDWVAWRGRATPAETDAHVQHFVRRLAGTEPAELPTDRPRSSKPRFEGGKTKLTLGRELRNEIETLARGAGATAPAVLLATLAAFVHRHVGCSRFAVGMPIANRNREEIEPLVGFFVNTVAIDFDFGDRPTMRALLQRTREAILDAHAHGEAPFDLVVDGVRRRTGNQGPLFQVVFAPQPPEADLRRFGAFSAQSLDVHVGASKFDLTLYTRPREEAIDLELEYDSDLFDQATIERMAEHFVTLLRAATARPDERVARLPLMSEAERRRVLVEWNDTRAEYASDKCIHELFEEQVARTPNAIAVEYGDERIRYAELNARANRLASWLREQGAGLESPVGVLMDRSVEMVTALYAILKAGAAYVPLDPELPVARLETMIAQAGARCILGQPHTTGLLREPVVDVVSLMGELSGRPTHNHSSGAHGAGRAYIIFTSGSTGTPKGVVNTHEGIRNRLQWMQQAFGLTSEDCVLQKTPFTFDVSVWEFFWPLMVGARLAVARASEHRDPRALVRTIRKHGVTTLHFVPSMLGAFLEDSEVSSCGSVRRVFCSGEALTPEQCRRFRERLGAELHNLYGPTEAAVDVTWWDCSKGPIPERVPIGRPIANTQVFVLDEWMNPAPIGVTGELHLGGIQLARGYVGRPDLTAERFVPSPFADAERLYRTGDLARFRADGALEYLGRIDHQVKVRGFRIELGEIEAALTSRPEVSAAVVVAREDAPGDKRLVGYVVAAAGAPIDVPAIKTELGRSLPDYMVPSAFVVLDALPLTPSGKVDRKALPAPALSASVTHVAPRDEVERKLAAIFESVLGIAGIGVEDDFFAVGGHSLLATRAISRVRELFDIDVPLRALFDRPTVAALAVHVREGGGAPTLRRPSIVRVDRSGPLQASFAQTRLWFLDRLEGGGSATYTVPTVLRLAGSVDAAVLEAALAELVRRHEALRTTFIEVDGDPHQVVHRDVGVTLRRLDARSEDEARALVRREIHAPFDLAKGPLVRTMLVRVRADLHLFVMCVHHIAVDAWSSDILMSELGALYRAFVEGKPSPLPTHTLDYPDFAAWQRSWLIAGVLDKQLAFWKEHLAGAPEALELPTDRPRPPVKQQGGDRVAFELGATIVEGVRALCKREGVTPFMVLLAAFQSLLSRWSGQKDIVVGTPIANRSHQELERMVGFFVNTVALRIRLMPDATFLDVLRHVKATAIAAFAHQDVPFERVVEELRVSRDPTRSPLFQAMLVFDGSRRAPDRLPGLTVAGELPGLRVAKFDVLLSFNEDGDVYRGDLEYDTALFDRRTMQRFSEHVTTLLEAATREPTRALEALPLMTTAERARLDGFNETSASYPSGCAHQLFEQTARTSPSAPALSMNAEVLSYDALNRRANQLAHHLRRRGVGAGTRVALCVSRSIDAMVGVLGILKAGAGYVPVDPAYPRDRIAFMLADSRPAAIVTHDVVEGLPEPSGVPIIRLDRDASTLSGESDENPDVPMADGLPCYVIYTSGSTGKPKAVVMPHRALVNLIHWQHESTSVLRGGVTLQFSPLSFDVSFQEMFSTWHGGGRLTLVDEDTRRDPAVLATLIEREKIERIFLPFVALRGLAEAACQRPTPLASLRSVVTAGEQLHVTKEIVAFFDRLPGCALHNHYGPSETHVVSGLTLDGAPSSWPPLPAIGKPISNAKLYVLDERLEQVPIGLHGELYVAGECLADGYLSRPDRTAERFVPDPYATRPGSRLYRTGDLARVRDDGTFEYLGRADHQVKVRGFRIELGEIEAALTALADVRAAVVVAREDTPGNKRLVGYVVAATGPRIDFATVKTELRRSLPDYMVPSAFVVLDALPLTPSGKVDRKALPAPDFSAASEAFVAPRSPLEETLAHVWREVLRLERAGVHDDFFALGGHSLLATQVVSRIRAVLGLEVPVRALFEAPTIAELAKRLERDRAEERASPPLVRREHGAPPAASFAQERLWFLDRLNPSSSAYNLPSAVQLRGRLDETALRGALDELVRRHEALRTTFAEEDGRPVQVIAPPTRMTYAKHDVSREGDPRGRARAVVADVVVRPFDLAKGPLVRAVLVRLAESDHVLVIAMHHVAGDAWSFDVMWRELWAAYAAFARGGASPLADLSLQYADYAVWQRDWLQGDVLERQVAFWKEHLSGAPAALELPADRPRPAVQTFRGGYVPFAIDSDTAARIKELCRRLGATPFMLLLSAFSALLSRYSGQRDLVIGTPIANRNRAETESLIGFFVNTLALRVGLEETATFEGLVRATKEMALAAYAHQDVPFERVVDALGVPRDLSRTPVFQVMFNMQNVAGEAERRHVGDLETEPYPISDSTVAKFDLMLFIGDAGSSFHGGLEYNSDLFDRATIERMAEHLITLLRAAIARPEERVARLPLMSEAEKRRVLVEWNDTRAEYASDRCLHELFEEQVARTPNAIAVEDEDERIRYAELEERAESIATWLAARGAGRGQRVAISLSRSVNMVAALLGVLKAGAAYVPVDPHYPEDRKQFMRDDAGCVAELTEATIAEALAGPATNRVGERARPSDLAYVLYTSGSTGRPKGVMVEHRNVVNLVRAMLRDPGMAPTDVELALTTLSFDVAGAEIYVPLAAGARIVVASEETARDPRLLSELIARSGANTAGATPATWQMLVADGWRPGPGMHIHCAGEALPRDLASALLERGAKLYNFYGPTETAIYATGMRIEAGEAITIGRPIVNTATYVLDRDMEPAPAGVVGELHIGGANVAPGYNSRPELTAEKFLPDPFSSQPGARMYATGDLARWRADGTLDYLGRNDHQVKVRGFRIELGEIEAALTSRADVSAAVVVAREDTPRDKRLVGYLVAAAGARLDVATIKTQLGRSLPDYMVPSAFVVVDALPLTPSGKVDRKALPAPDFSSAAAAYVAPRSPLEESLARIWCDVLKLERAGVHDDFFAVGGHSLLATQIVSRVRSVLALELPVRVLFEAPTIAELATRLEGERAEESTSPPLVRREHSAPPAASFAQERLWFLDRFHPGSHTYNVPSAVHLRGPLDEAALRRALDELVRRHEALRTTFAEEDGRPVQVIAPPTGMMYAKHDVSRDGEPERRARELMAEEVARPFDLATGPLVRAVLLRLAGSDHVLLVAMHHVVSDAWSIDVMWRELWTAYAAFADGRPSPLGDLSLQYADYAVWQREWLQGDVLERQVAFWKEHLAGAPAALELPTDRPRPPVQTFRGGYVPFAIDADTTARTRELCRRLGATPFMPLLSAFGVLLSRYTGQRDVVIGTPIANRNRAETESLIGFFVNTLPLRVGLEERATFEELVRATKETALAAYAHQDVPFERVVDALGVTRDLSRTPVFQVMFNMQNVADDAERGRVGDLETELYPFSDWTVAKFDLMLFVGDAGSSLRGGLEYNSDLFDRATVERMAEHFVTLLRAATARPDEMVERLPLSGTLDAIETNRARDESFWLKRLTRAPSVSLLSELERRSASGARERRSSAMRVDGGELQAFARRIDVDPAAVLLAVFLGYAAGTARAEEIALAYRGPQIDRRSAERPRLGASWVPLVIEGHKGETFVAFARRVSEEMTRLEARGDYRLDLIGRTPELRKEAVPRWKQTAGVVLGSATGGTDGPPLLFRIDRGGSASVEFDAAHFEASLVELLVERLGARLADAMQRPEATLDDLPLLTEDERRKVLFDWNATEAPTPRGLIHEHFVARAARAPDAIAVVETGRAPLTYGELDRRSTFLAQWLRARGLRRGGHVGVWIERSSELVVAMLGILKAGGIYVPLERRWPGRRIASIANGLSMRWLVTKSANEALVTELLPETPSLREVLYVDRDLEDATPDDDRAPPADIAETDLAYIIFTSGSTGEPKGVVVTHRAAVNLMTWVNVTFGVGPEDRLLFVTSPCFDLSIYDVFGTLAAGGSIRVASEEEVAEPTTLLRIMRDDGITFWDSAPAVLLQLAAFFKKGDAALRIVFLSGDWVPVSLPDRVREAFPRARVIALGGATEATVWSNFFPVGEVDLSWRSIPYGRPITNAQYYVLDDELAPCPVGLAGDLYIGGECLSGGYTDPILTAGKFVPDPYRGVPGARLYRTGDRARFLADGNIEFLGRLDNQVKVRGYRIELGEIEAAMRAHPSVREAFGHVRERGSREDKELIAYVVPRSGERVDVEELRTLAKQRLPEYMVPSAFVLLDALPLTPNGKVDRKALPVPDVSSAAAEYVAPRDALEETLAAIFCEVLGLARVGIHDDFFALGGHSLLATRVVSRIAGQLDVEIRVRALFEAATVARLAERVRATSGRSRDEPRLVRAPEPLAPAMSFGQEVLAAWESRRSPSETWNGAARIDLRGPLDVGILRDAVAATVADQEVLRWAYDARAGLKVLPPAAIPFEVVDVGGGSDLDVDSICSTRARTPFAFDGSPLTRFFLLRRSSTEHVLLLAWHAFANALSRKRVIADHLMLHWRSIVERAPPPEPTAIRYTDFVAWERAWYSAGGREEVLAAKKSLDGARPLEIADYPRSGPVSAAAIDDFVTLDAEDSARVHRVARAMTVSPFTLFIATASMLLSRWSECDDITILSPVDLTPRHEAVRQVVGFFHNWQAIRIKSSGNPSFAELVARARTAVNEARDFDAAPAPLVFDSPDVFDHPLNRALLSTPSVGAGSEDASPLIGQIGEVTATEGELARLRSGARNALGIGMWSDDVRVHVVLRGATELFRPETIAARRAELCAILRSLAPDTPISKL